MRTRLIAILIVAASLPLLQCGGTNAGGTSPSPTPVPSPSPSPSPSPAPSPSPGPSGASLVVSPQSIQGQQQSQGTVTLAASAPAGGAIVALATSDATVAHVPASVTVAGGATSASFLIDAATVQTPQTVTITASYAGSTMAATLAVTPPALVASFVARSPTHGTGACQIADDLQELDCVVDGSGSSGFVRQWAWTFATAGTTRTQSSFASNVKPQIGCDVLQTANGGDGPNGDHFLNMTISLQVVAADGSRSAITSQAIRLYPNRQCGFSY